MSTKTNPGYFKDLVGIELEEYDSVNFGRQVEVSGMAFKGHAKTWCDLNEEAMTTLLKSIADEIQLNKILQDSIPNVDAVKKVKNGEVYTVVMNHNNYSVDLQLKGTFSNKLGDENMIDHLSLKPYDVCILTK